ncbi:MAG: hypothetical protein IKS42_01005 [Oscillospiraceae bacterium]|nr:hypothetical protein [Oscillospiraceae bacterium]
MKLRILSLALIVLIVCVGCGGKPKAEATIRKYVSAYNHHDQDQMIECYEPSVQKAYDAAQAAGNAIMESTFWGTLIGNVAEKAQEEADDKENKTRLSVKFKGRERIDEDTVVLTVEYTYTSRVRSGKKAKTEKVTEEREVKMVRIDDVWYIAAPVDLSKLTEGLGKLGEGLGEIGKDLQPAVSDAFSAIGSAVSGMMSGLQTQTTAAAAAPALPFSFERPDPADPLEAEIVSQLRLGKCVLDLKGYSDFETIKAAIYRVRESYPQYFWVNGFQTEMLGSDTTVTFSPFRNLPEDQYLQAVTALEEAGTAILSQMPEGISDYEKALYVHDYLVDHCVYDEASVDLQETALVHTAYGCIVQGSAVCEGYARAYQYLMQALGFECGTVSGIARNSHAWNYISIGGSYYWVDVTWDDPISTGGETIAGDNKKHTYFLLDDAHIFRTRTLDDDNLFVPQCSSMELNWFVQQGLYFETYDRAAVLAQISAMYSADPAGKMEFMFGSAEAYAAAMQDLIENGQIRSVPGLEYTAYNYYTDDEMFVLSFVIG